MEQSLIILKPDALQRGLVGPILTRLEARGLKFVGLKLMQISSELAHKHYGTHEGKPFFAGLVDYITSAPSVLLILEGPDAVAITRTTNGATKPAEAAPGTIRADFGLTIGRNLVHSSDSVESAAREVETFFGSGGIVDYTKAIDAWLVED